MKKHIFAAKRGEGKTKWLINKALESQKNGKDIVYVGTVPGYIQFVGELLTTKVTSFLIQRSLH